MCEFRNQIFFFFVPKTKSANHQKHQPARCSEFHVVFLEVQFGTKEQQDPNYGSQVRICLNCCHISLGRRSHFHQSVSLRTRILPPEAQTLNQVREWTNDEVVAWAKTLIEEQHAELLKTQDITGHSLLQMTQEDFEDCGIPVGSAENLKEAILACSGGSQG